MQNQEIAVAAEAIGERHQHLFLIEDVHIVVENKGMLDARMAVERSQESGSTLAGDILADLNVDMPDATSPWERGRLLKSARLL